MCVVAFSLLSNSWVYTVTHATTTTTTNPCALQQVRHPHVVSLVDVLEVSTDSFATVQEFCEGGDLDTLLREHGVRARVLFVACLCVITRARHVTSS